jgi:hypothetical protein
MQFFVNSKGATESLPNEFCEVAWMNIADFNQLRSSILSQRIYGITTVVLRPRTRGDDPRLAADSLVVSQGFEALGSHWRVIDRTRAAAILRMLLHRDLAYNCEIMSPPVANGLADQFLSFFSGLTVYLTNGGEDGLGFAFASITECTFDTGIVSINRSVVGMLWVQDED